MDDEECYDHLFHGSSLIKTDETEKMRPDKDNNGKNVLVVEGENGTMSGTFTDEFSLTEIELDAVIKARGSPQIGPGLTSSYLQNSSDAENITRSPSKVYRTRSSRQFSDGDNIFVHADPLDINIDEVMKNRVENNANGFHPFSVEQDIPREKVGYPYRIQSTKMEMVRLSTFFFAYGYIFGSMGLCIIPLEAQHLWPLNPALAQAYLLAICGFTQMVNPVIGKISDSWKSDTVLGKRMPLFIIFTIQAVLSVLCLAFASFIESYLLYCGFLTIAMIAFNSCFALRTAVPFDLLEDSIVQSVSGVQAGMSLLGSSCGFLTVIGSAYFSNIILYILFGTILAICALVSAKTDFILQNRMERQGKIIHNKFSDNNRNCDLEDIEAALDSYAIRKWYDKPICHWVGDDCTLRTLASTLYIDRKNQ